MEIKAVLESGDSENYVSHFPVHQDGSCNGLQHYAALGRDKSGGESVNLIPAAVPQDVYSCVVELVSIFIMKIDGRWFFQKRTRSIECNFREKYFPSSLIKNL